MWRPQVTNISFSGLCLRTCSNCDICGPLQTLQCCFIMIIWIVHARVRVVYWSIKGHKDIVFTNIGLDFHRCSR